MFLFEIIPYTTFIECVFISQARRSHDYAQGFLKEYMICYLMFYDTTDAYTWDIRAIFELS